MSLGYIHSGPTAAALDLNDSNSFLPNILGSEPSLFQYILPISARWPFFNITIFILLKTSHGWFPPRTSKLPWEAIEVLAPFLHTQPLSHQPCWVCALCHGLTVLPSLVQSLLGCLLILHRYVEPCPCSICPVPPTPQCLAQAPLLARAAGQVMGQEVVFPAEFWH